MLVGNTVERKTMPIFFVEEGIVDKREAMAFLGGIGETKFDEKYKDVCARDQGGKSATYLKSDLYRRYLELTDGPHGE